MGSSNRSTWANLGWFPRHISRKQDKKQSSQDSNKHSSWHCKSWLSLLTTTPSCLFSFFLLSFLFFFCLSPFLPSLLPFCFSLYLKDRNTHSHTGARHRNRQCTYSIYFSQKMLKYYALTKINMTYQ